MTTTTTTTSEQTTRYPTKAKCRNCGGPVYAQNQQELHLIKQWPRDGFWMCEKCRGKGK